jgi:hypothetical protein
MAIHHLERVVEWKGQGRAGSGRNIPLDLQVNFLPNPMLTPFPTEPFEGRIRL